MRLASLALLFALFFNPKPSLAESVDYFNEKIEVLASRFTSLNIPDLEKIQLPKSLGGGAHVLIYVWLPKTHSPDISSFEANVADYFDVVGSQSRAFDGWCYLKRPEKYVLKTPAGEVGVMRIWALSYNGAAPLKRCPGGVPTAAGQLGQTQVIKDPQSGLLTMVRSGHPTRFPDAEARLQ